MARVRCAIYTRKSSEDGLEQDFNSLDAQREACAAFIASQKAEGWVLLPEHYDDGGLSGGTLERPALMRLMRDLEAGKVDQIVVYKIDRLTRSLADFAKLVERLDAAGASFVSVTQSFNTATSMGRLTLNVLLSFAQFEREVTAERIRDKIAASKRRGLWMGGLVPFGYDADGRTLKIREDEAAVVRQLFELYRRLGTVRAVHAEALRLGFRSRVRVLASGRTVGGGSFSRGHIHQMLSNPLYAGRIRHKRLVHDGQHPAIIAPDLWEAVQAGLADNAARERGTGNSGERSPFAGKLFDETGDRLTPSHANKRGVRHRYYVSHRLVRAGSDVRRLRLAPAGAGAGAGDRPGAGREVSRSGVPRQHRSRPYRRRDRPRAGCAGGSGGPACRRGSGRRRSRRGSGAAGDDRCGYSDRRSRRPCPLVCSRACRRSTAA